MMNALEARTVLRQAGDRAQLIVKDLSLSDRQKSAKMTELEGKVAEAKSALELSKRSGLLAAGGSSIDSREGRRLIGKDLIPAPKITPSEDQMHDLYDAVLSHKSIRIDVETKGVGDLVPDQLMPGVVSLPHEPTRMLEVVPTTGMTAPVAEYIQHQSTTGTAGTVAPGGLKPAVTLNMVKLEARARKIAVTTTINDEDLADYGSFAQYVTNELTRLVIDEENLQILSGDGTGENLLGLLNQTGILTRAVGTDTGLDAMEEAITDLRNGPAFCPTNLIVLNPTTFSKLRRSKDTQGRYLLNPDPSASEASSLWGTPVLQTTQLVAGTGVVLNTEQAAEAMIRQGITIQADYGAAGFEHNTTSFRVEERTALAAPRPAAVLKVTGL